MPDEKERFRKVFDILQDNQAKDFVRRILDPENSPAIINADGTPSTHEMATAEAEGVHYVFPTIMRDEQGLLRRFHDENDKFASFNEALRRGEAIGFKTAEEAEWFERNWKVVWGEPARK